MSEEKQQKWNKFEHEIIPGYVVRINDLEADKKDLISELAEKIKLEDIMPTYMICAFLKDILMRLKAEISDRSIEKALGDEYKVQKDVLDDQRTSSVNDSKKTIEVSTSGSQQIRSKPKLSRSDDIFGHDKAQSSKMEKDLWKIHHDRAIDLEKKLELAYQEIKELKQQKQAQPRRTKTFTTLIIGKEKFPSNWDKVFANREDNVFVITVSELDRVESIEVKGRKLAMKLTP
jgi:hypothetical protein